MNYMQEKAYAFVVCRTICFWKNMQYKSDCLVIELYPT